MELPSFESHYPDTTRFAQISKLWEFIKEGSSAQLIGLPGTGRSTLLSLLANNRQVRIKHVGEDHKKVHFVVANFSEIRKRPLFDVMKYLFLNLTESLRERKMLEEHKAVGDIFREHLKFDEELILFQGFKEAVDYLCLERDITVVLLFDRFEEYIPTVTDAFFANLRILRNRAKYKFSVIFSVYRPLESNLEPSVLSDYYEFVAGHIVYLPLADKDATDFRISYIEHVTQKKVAPELLIEIVRQSGGVGRIIKLAVEAVLVHGQEQKNVSKFLLQQNTIKSALAEIWSVFTPIEQQALLKNQFTDKESTFYLETMGVVKANSIQIPLLEEFIHTTFGDQQAVKTTIFYDEHTNAIKKGEEIISDKLTASEYKLLRYLLQHNDRIVERGELIDAVWGDNKSTAGITDQAVDQLIFRLRRKIEEDANNPSHLQTVKGRGFKLVNETEIL
jgi:DNA-binding winged helix-turn-helix (wHTH) protein